MKYVGRSEPTEHVVCIDGKGRGPVEDTLAPESFAYTKRAYNSKRRSKDLKQRIQWYEENVDPAGFSREKQFQRDKDKVNSYLPKLEIPPPTYRPPVLIGMDEEEEEVDDYEDEAEIKAEDASPFPDAIPLLKGMIEIMQMGLAVNAQEVFRICFKTGSVVLLQI